MKLLRFLFSVLLLVLTAVCGYGQCQWDRFRKATDDATEQGKALTAAIDNDPSIIDDWERLDNAGSRDMEVGFGKASDKESWLSDLKKGIYQNGRKGEYLNPEGYLITWELEHPNSLANSIESVAKSADRGKAVEGTVAKYLKDNNKRVIGRGVGMTNVTDKSTAGDIDVMLECCLIEAKSSISSFDKDQMSKFVNTREKNYLNPYGRKVIVYIDKPLTVDQATHLRNSLPPEITLVNSLEELLKIVE